jgi:hypothetical protein
MIGRGTRLCEGKSELLVLDFLWHFARHKLCRPASLLSENEDMEDKLTKLFAESDEPMDINEAIETVQAADEREATLALELEVMKHNESKKFDQVKYEMGLTDGVPKLKVPYEMTVKSRCLRGYTPTFQWEERPPSDKQLQLLRDLSVDTAEIDCMGKAALLIDTLISRRKNGFSTLKQIKCLEKFGFNQAQNWNFEAANDMISMIADNKWNIPVEIVPSEYVPEQ